MPAEDPGDVFLHHRGLVLEALLTDPSFDQPAAAGRDPGLPMSAAGGSESTPAYRSESGPAESASSESAQRRSTEGPKASERILALLNGGPQEAGTPHTFTEPAAMPSATAPPPAEPDPGPPPAAGRNGPPLAQVADRVLAQLRKPKVALAVGACFAVLLVLLLVTTGGQTKNAADDGPLVVTAPPTPVAPTSPATPAAGKIEVKSAQSKCPPGSTSAMDAFSGDPGKAWSCFRAFKVDGQVLTIDLGKQYQIESIGIVPGWDSIGKDGTDQWSKYRTVSRVSYRFDDGNATVFTQQTLDQRTLVVTKIEPPIRASKIVLTVLESKGDPSVNVTAVSSVVLTGR